MKIRVDDYLKNRRSFTAEEKQFLLNNVADRCVHCGAKLDIHTITVEHLYPISKGGLNDIFNLVPLCHDCNEIKSNDIYSFFSYFNPKYFKNDTIAIAYRFYNALISLDTHLDGSIFPYDINYMSYMPRYNGKNAKQLQLINNCMNKSNKKKGKDKYHSNDSLARILPRVTMKKAFPADADRIISLIEKCKQSENFHMTNSYYTNIYEIHNAIRDDKNYTYVVETPSGEFQGVFIFEELSKENTDYLHTVRSVVDAEKVFGTLTPKYILTLGLIKGTVSGCEDALLNEAMRHFLDLGYLLVYAENCGVYIEDYAQKVKINHNGTDVDVLIDCTEFLVDTYHYPYQDFLYFCGLPKLYKTVITAQTVANNLTTGYKWSYSKNLYVHVETGDEKTEEELDELANPPEVVTGHKFFKLMMEIIHNLDVLYNNDPYLYKKYGDFLAEFPSVRESLKAVKTVIKSIYGVGIPNRETYYKILKDVATNAIYNPKYQDKK